MKSRLLLVLILSFSFSTICLSQQKLVPRPSSQPEDSVKAADGETPPPACSADDKSSESGPPRVSEMVGQPARWELLDGKHLVAVIFQNHVGAFQITIDPDYRYQWALMTGEGFRDGSRVTLEYHEVSTVNLGAGAATRMGWRNPLRLDRFIVPVTQFTGRQLPDGQSFVDVKSDVAGRFLIVITKIEVPPNR